MRNLAFRMLVCVLVFCLALPALAQRVRKHVEDLTDDELKALDHAIGKLKALPESDVNNYYSWADIHGDSSTPGWGCDHGSELLLPWHRAYLLAFENAVRAIDPPVTKDITLPYWDWTEKPTGDRYPKAFETWPNLLPACKTPCKNPRITTKNTNPPYSPTEIQRIQDIDNWTDYGGGTPGSGKSGDIEDGPHNYIHGTYIFGLNKNTRFAARDPLFWLHHSNLDRLWAAWQADPRHQGPQYDPVCGSCSLRFLPNKVVKDYNSIAALGYSYQPRRKPLAAREAVEIAGIIGLTLPKAAMVAETALALPPFDAIDKVKLVFDDVALPQDAPYLVRTYLRPAGSDPATRSESDILAVFALWPDAGHAQHGGVVDIDRDVTGRFRQIAGARTNVEKWVLQIDILKMTDEGTLAGVRLGEGVRWKNLSVAVDSKQTLEVK